MHWYCQLCKGSEAQNPKLSGQQLSRTKSFSRQASKGSVCKRMRKKCSWAIIQYTWVLKTRQIKKIHIIIFRPNFRKLQDDSKNVSLKIGSRGPQKLGPFSHFSSWEKRLSSGQKWFLRPFSPLIRGMFLLRSGLTFWNPLAICENLASTKKMGIFFRLDGSSGPMCALHWPPTLR